jgi:acetyl-CoA carboxylase carboxyl transferase alpha subunit
MLQCRTGGARMQEGTSSLMQMAKVSVAVEALHKAGIPFISVLSDPTYGGVSASYAMQADVRIALSDARIGFAGPAVILNTMCEANQSRFDNQCPPDFQSASYVLQYGQIDMVQDLVAGESAAQTQLRVEGNVARIASNLLSGGSDAKEFKTAIGSLVEVSQQDKEMPFNYTRSRHIDRPQTQDIVLNCFDSFIELVGDGKVGKDACIRGGLAYFGGRSCVVIGTFKGHTPKAMQDSNYGMPSPHGYRTAMRLMKLAERFNLPVVTLVDTVGAWPTFECEQDGQSEAIATNLTVMAGLTVPIITILVGEGGSGGALGIGMGNVVGMLSGGYFGVISPEGAASILGRYKDDAHKSQQFPLDCHELATAQCIYAYQLKELGVVDEIIWESASGETYKSFPVLKERIQQFILSTLANLSKMSVEEIVAHRYSKFRQLGTFSLLDAGARAAAIETAVANKTTAKRPEKVNNSPSDLIKHLSDEVISGTYSRYKNLCPSTVPTVSPTVPVIPKAVRPEGWTNAKKVLDASGPEALASWVKAQKRVLITDTTMRDAHQSLLATRVRTQDLVPSAAIANELLKDLFSLECWGGATFDVCMRFLDECPWERLRELRAACPDVMLQCLIRGANGVGYTSYPDNVVTEFVRLAALNGMDVFRIFDCFNIVENMKVSIAAVRAVNKVAEVCLCYTGNVLTSEIYNLEYYKDVAREAVVSSNSCDLYSEKGFTYYVHEPCRLLVLTLLASRTWLVC